MMSSPKSEHDGETPTNSPPPYDDAYSPRPPNSPGSPGPPPKPRPRPITESSVLKIQDLKTLHSFVKAFGEFDQVHAREAVLKRNERVRELINNGVCVDELGAVMAADRVEVEEREEKKALAIARKKWEERMAQKGMLPKEQRDVEGGGEDQMEVGLETPSTLPVEDEDEDEEVEDAEAKKKKKKNRKKKKKGKAQSPNKEAGSGDAAWAKGRRMSQDLEVVEEVLSVKHHDMEMDIEKEEEKEDKEKVDEVKEDKVEMKVVDANRQTVQKKSTKKAAKPKVKNTASNRSSDIAPAEVSDKIVKADPKSESDTNSGNKTSTVDDSQVGPIRLEIKATALPPAESITTKTALDLGDPFLLVSGKKAKKAKLSKEEKVNENVDAGKNGPPLRPTASEQEGEKDTKGDTATVFSRLKMSESKMEEKGGKPEVKAGGAELRGNVKSGTLSTPNKIKSTTASSRRKGKQPGPEYGSKTILQRHVPGSRMAYEQQLRNASVVQSVTSESTPKPQPTKEVELEIDQPTTQQEKANPIVNLKPSPPQQVEPDSTQPPAQVQQDKAQPVVDPTFLKTQIIELVCRTKEPGQLRHELVALLSDGIPKQTQPQNVEEARQPEEIKKKVWDTLALQNRQLPSAEILQTTVPKTDGPANKTENNAVKEPARTPIPVAMPAFPTPRTAVAIDQLMASVARSQTSQLPRTSSHSDIVSMQPSGKAIRMQETKAAQSQSAPSVPIPLPPIAPSPNVDTPLDPDLITPHRPGPPTFPKQTYPRERSYEPARPSVYQDYVSRNIEREGNRYWAPRPPPISEYQKEIAAKLLASGLAEMLMSMGQDRSWPEPHEPIVHQSSARSPKPRFSGPRSYPVDQGLPPARPAHSQSFNDFPPARAGWRPPPPATNHPAELHVYRPQQDWRSPPRPDQDRSQTHFYNPRQDSQDHVDYNPPPQPSSYDPRQDARSLLLDMPESQLYYLGQDSHPTGTGRNAPQSYDPPQDSHPAATGRNAPQSYDPRQESRSSAAGHHPPQSFDSRQDSHSSTGGHHPPPSYDPRQDSHPSAAGHPPPQSYDSRQDSHYPLTDFHPQTHPQLMSLDTRQDPYHPQQYSQPPFPPQLQQAPLPDHDPRYSHPPSQAPMLRSSPPSQGFQQLPPPQEYQHSQFQDPQQYRQPPQQMFAINHSEYLQPTPEEEIHRLLAPEPNPPAETYQPPSPFTPNDPFGHKRESERKVTTDPETYRRLKKLSDPTYDPLEVIDPPTVLIVDEPSTTLVPTRENTPETVNVDWTKLTQSESPLPAQEHTPRTVQSDSSRWFRPEGSTTTSLHPPPLRMFETAESVGEINMPIQVVTTSPSSVRNIKMNRAYTLYFTKANKSSSPGSGLNVTADKEKYLDELVPMFTAETFGDFFGSWMALRRGIASTSARSIEPAHCGRMVPGSEGLGIGYLAGDKTVQMFVKGVKPAWEDPMCANGGRIVMSAPPEDIFFKLALNLVAGCFDTSCPSPRGTDQMVLGIVQMKKAVSRPRLDVWLGASGNTKIEAFSPWAIGVVEYLKKEFPGAEVWRYKPFTQ